MLPRKGSGVPLVVPANGIEHQRVILNGSGQRTNLVQGGGKRHQPVAGNRTISGLHAHNAAERRGLTNGTAGIRPEGIRRFIRGHGSRRTAGAAPGHPAGICRVARQLQGGIFTGRAHGELIHIQFTQKDIVTLFQPFNDIRIIGRHIVFQHFGSAGGAHAPGADIVLDAGGNARKRRKALPFCAFFIHGCRSSQRLFGIKADISADGAIGFINRVQIRLSQLLGAVRAALQRRAVLADRAFYQLVHLFRPPYSTTLGTVT